MRPEFEEAVKLAPDNERIRRNFEAFEEGVAGYSALRSAWEEPDESAVRAFGRIEYEPVLVA